jgi:benzoylformate decarboxylase
MAGSTVAEETFEVLRRFGVDRAFGNPGSTEMHMFAYWPSDLDYVLALQEASVVAMADGYAQRSGRPGFVNLHTAAGLGNAMGSVVAAARNNTRWSSRPASRLERCCRRIPTCAHRGRHCYLSPM